MRNKKKYFLFLIGDFTNQEEFPNQVDEIIDVLRSVMTTTSVKYIHHDNLILLHFQSYDTMEEIDFHLNNSFSDSILSYFLMPKPRKLGLRLDEDLKKHLIDLKNNTFKNLDFTVNENLNDDFSHVREILYDYKDNFTTEFNENLNERKNYNLDDVLDKINDKGMGSLTKQEEEFLKSLSNK